MDEDQLGELQTSVRALHAQFRRSLPEVDGVSRTAVRVLGAIARAQSSSVQPRQLADELSMASSNVAAALRELEQAGYVVRHRDPEDGRRVSAALTPHGSQAVAAHRSLRVSGLREAVESALTPTEQQQLAAVIPYLSRIVAAGQEEGNQ